jgi:hypothetical protein
MKFKKRKNKSKQQKHYEYESISRNMKGYKHGSLFDIEILKKKKCSSDISCQEF